jgi:hypothetical protein
MTSVSEVSNKEIWQKARTKTTIQKVLDYTKHKEKLSTVRPTTQRYFMICQTCFWCASYTGTIDIMNELPFERCPTCNDNKIESFPSFLNLIVMSTRHLVEWCWNFLDLEHFGSLRSVINKQEKYKNITR